MTEFKLSDWELEAGVIPSDKVKEFIRRLKDALKNGLKYDGNKIMRNEWVIIDTLTGDLE